MRLAFTMDDLPVFPHVALPDGYTPASVADKIGCALLRNDVAGVYAFANSWPLDVDPEMFRIIDAWTSVGHFIGNHTHSHPLLNDVGAEAFIADIMTADELLKPWIDQAPQMLFRHPLNMWGNTEEKREAVAGHLNKIGYTPVDATSFLFEWEWDSAWQWLLQSGKQSEADALKSDFIDFCIQQLAYDRSCCRDLFDRDIIGIVLAHFVVFFAEVADPLLTRMHREGIEIVPLADALVDPAYERVGAVVTDEFQVYQQKLSAADGHRVRRVAPACRDLMKRIFELAKPMRPPRLGQLVQNRHGPNP